MTGGARVVPPAVPRRRRSRQEEILEIAVGLFAARGYHGVSMDDIGAAAGRHRAGALPPLRRQGGDAGRRAQPGQRGPAGRRAGTASPSTPDDPRGAAAALVDFHVDFALDNPAVIALHLHELDRLPEEPRREIRRLQRLYVEEWVQALTALRPELADGEARVLAHAAFGLMNSTPFLGGEVDRDRRAELLRAATLAALPGRSAAPAARSA